MRYFLETLARGSLAVVLAAAACQAPEPAQRRPLAAAPAWRAPAPAPQVMVADPVPWSEPPAQVMAPVESAAPAAADDAAPEPAAAPAAAPVAPVPPPPGSPMTEQQRSAAFRALVGPPRTFTPPPPTAAVRRVVEYERRVVPASYGYACDDCRWQRCRVHHSYAGPRYVGPSLARTALYAGAGAIIGHQFHHRDRGAAIGAVLGLLSSPWHRYDAWDCGWDW